MLCRICRAMIVDTCILSLTNMPSSAQNFPTKETLSFDKGSDLEVYQCSDCGLVQLTNDPVDYYCDVIRASAYSDEMKLFRIDQFHALGQKYNLYGKKVLEVGCGKGEYLSLLISTGFDAYGVENAKESVLYCINNHYRVYEGFLGESNLMIKDAPFDAFVCFNFMEHWPDPRSTLSVLMCSNALLFGITIYYQQLFENVLLSILTSSIDFALISPNNFTVISINFLKVR